jgi:membrane-associated protease RseP (regulator of RpoE activity)
LSGTVVIALYVVAILVIVLIHEAAHFGAAKAFGIKVEEFFVGFGPRLWSFRRGETEYGLKALPLGGYVRIAGMNPFQEPTPEELPRTFGSKPAWQRAVVIAAGPFTHFVLAFLIFFLWLTLLGLPSRFSPVVGAVEATLNGRPSPAAVAGLRAGDEIVAVDQIRDPGDDELVSYTREHVGEPVRLGVMRGDRTFTVSVTPVLAEVEGERVGRIGVRLTAGRVLERDRSGPIVGISEAGSLFGQHIWGVLRGFGQVFDVGRVFELLFGGEERTIEDPASVVGGGRIAVQAAQEGAVDVLFEIFAAFNVFVGILNLLPIPPFDGGHLAVIGVEKVTGRRVDARRLVPITAAVAFFLILYMGSLILLDITKPLPNLFR